MKRSALLGMATLLCTCVFSQDSMLSRFRTPPQAAKPRVWWHWMSGNITKEGIRKDLLWMYRSGIGGMQNFDASLLTPQIVEKRLTYMTPDWQDAFRFTTKLADSLKLELAIAGSPGWSESGGPWVKPEDGMKKLVWQSAYVQGGASNIRFPQPSGMTGPFQDIPLGGSFGEGVDVSKLLRYYKDVAVIAFRLPEADRTMKEMGATVSSSGGQFTLDQLTDGDLGNGVLLPRDSSRDYAWIQFAFPQSQTIHAITMVGAGSAGTFGFGGDPADGRKLEVSDDGVNYRFVMVIPIGDVLQNTVNFKPVTARYFRITVKNPKASINPLVAMMGVQMEMPKDPPGTLIQEIVLHAVPRVHRFEEKAGYSTTAGFYNRATENTADVVSADAVVDLTGKLRADGSLGWTAPAGRWKVLRFGYSLKGINNHPASPEATGLEVDKLDPAAIKRYFTTYLDQYKQATGGLMGARGLSHMITDSWEAGAQNWTGNMISEFRKRRGYSMLPWMPVLTGHVVKTAEASEQFLFDLRKTIGEMTAEYHYDGLTEILKTYGMKRYSESQEDGRAMIADGMEVKRTADIPMSAMWTPSMMNGFNQHKYTMDIRESAAVAHIYGQNIVAAESLTALGIGGLAWSYSPANLKSSADLELAHGLNRFVIHTSVHQPLDDKIPGLGLGPFGQWFNRHDTWANQAKAWSDYLARSSYMLQQGRFVADIVYYYGEDNNITALFREKPPVIPEGYNYDFINADALVHKLDVKDGKLVTATGMRYSVLWVDSNALHMSLPVLRKIRDLVKAGAVVAGARPKATPSLSDNQQEFDAIVKEVWGSGNAKVTEGISLQDVLASQGVKPDLQYTKADTKTKILFVHRSAHDREIYWVNNRNARDEKITVTFRVTGKVPMVWHPEDARTEAVSYRINNGVTEVDLSLTPNDAVFVVFKDKAATSAKTIAPATETRLADVRGPWTVGFQKDRGAPASVTMDALASWTTSTDAGVKYFSGTATYKKTIDADKSWFSKGVQLVLDLGEVKELAEVIVNGKNLGIIWKAPYRVDVTSALKAGQNSVEIRVTNLWVNRLIGDEQPGAKKITYTTMPFYQAGSKLLPSGLLGPVSLIALKH